MFVQGKIQPVQQFSSLSELFDLYIDKLIPKYNLDGTKKEYTRKDNKMKKYGAIRNSYKELIVK